MFKRKKVGLALGGGGARGMAHIGVLKILEDYKIPIDMIAGTSIGAVIGAMYSAEPNAKKLEKEAIETDWKSLFDYTISKRGLIKGNKLYDFFKERFHGMEFKDLKIPLYVTSFDLEERREVVFSKGDLAKAIRSSISIPGVFFPAENERRILIDGAVKDIIPNEILRKKGADIVIAVNVENVKEKKTLYDQEATKGGRTKELPNALQTLSRAIQVMQCENCKSEIAKEKVDLVISPNVESIDVLDFSKTKEAIKKGELKTRQSLKKLEKLTEPHPFKELFAYLNQDIDVKKLLKD
jgi:NTE family protein